jgi:hypothetical protein
MQVSAVLAAALLLLGAHHRSHAQRAEFQWAYPCPTNGHQAGRCPGYVVDHICPLACGGADRPWNMQWQTKAAAKAKDRWELSCTSC